MFQVKTKPNEQQFTTKEGESILEAAIREKVILPYGCGNGQCGSCKVFVTQGEYEYLHDYKAGVLSAQECNDGAMLCCMAKAKSNLEILVPERDNYPEIIPQIYEAKVIELEVLTDTVYKLVMEIDSNQFNYYPGQYIELLLPGDQRRAYSLARLPTRNEEELTQEIELHIRTHNKGLFSELLKDKVSIGYSIIFEGPQGHFLLNELSSSKIVFVGGGTGIVPIKLLLEYCLSQVKTESVYLFWGVKNQQELFHHDYFIKLAQENNDFHYIPVLSDPDDNFSTWKGATGIVSNHVVEKISDLKDCQLYVAGPSAMIQSCQNIFPAYGLSENNFFTDIFYQPGKKSEFKKKNFFQKLFS